MYAIYCDGKLLHYPRLASEGYVALSPKLTLELNKPGRLDFLLPVSNPMYDNVQKMKSIITVYQDGMEIFRGRCLDSKKDLHKRKKITCEGDMAFLLDSVQRPYSFQGDIPELLEQYISVHNAQVDAEKQFSVGMVTVTDPNNYVSRNNSEHSDTLTEIKDKLIKTHGGYLRTRLSEGVRYVDLVESYDHVNTQTIEFGRNLLDLTEYINAQEVYTVLIPLGAVQEDAEGNDAGRLTIESVNDGKDYIEDPVAIALFGRIWKTQKWDDVTLPENLLAKGNAALQSGIEMAVTLEIRAVDLHLVDVDTEGIKLGDYVRVISVPHGLDKYFLCSKIVHDLADPSKNEYTFGVTFRTLTERQASEVKALQNTFVSVQTSAQSAQNSAASAQNSANQAAEKVEEVIVKIPTDYVKTEEFEAYKQEVSVKISAVYKFKGSVASYDALPTVNREIGDTYNLLDTGANYAWTDSGWDKLSETIDLSGYVTKEVYDALEERVKTLEGSNT